MNIKSNILLILTTLFMALFFIACSQKDNQYLSKNNDKLENINWKLESLNGKNINKSSKDAFIKFDRDLKVFGNLGCNNFFARYKLDKNILHINKVGSTMMMCQNMENEQNFLKILEEVKNYKIDNNILIFFSDENKELAKFIKE